MTPLTPPRWFEGVMYTAYGDESADETKQRVFAIGGLFGYKSDWDLFRGKWTNRTGGKVFHAAECDSNQGDYEHTSNDENKKLYADLSNIIAESNLIGRAIAINLVEYKETLGPMLDKEPYYLCFVDVVIHLARQAVVCIPRDRIKFTFDRNTQIEYSAGALYDGIINRDYPHFKELLDDEIAFATRKEIGIQAADLIAREGMKLLDNQCGPVSRPTRLSTQTLQSCKRIKFRSLRRSWFEETIRGAAQQTDPKYAMYSKTTCKEWLAERGLQLNLANKIKYELYIKKRAKDDAKK